MLLTGAVVRDQGLDGIPRYCRVVRYVVWAATLGMVVVTLVVSAPTARAVESTCRATNLTQGRPSRSNQYEQWGLGNRRLCRTTLNMNDSSSVTGNTGESDIVDQSSISPRTAATLAWRAVLVLLAVAAAFNSRRWLRAIVVPALTGLLGLHVGLSQATGVEDVLTMAASGWFLGVMAGALLGLLVHLGIRFKVVRGQIGEELSTSFAGAIGVLFVFALPAWIILFGPIQSIMDRTS